MNAPSIFSRILLVLGAIAVVGLTYWFIATSLAPLDVPPGAQARGSVRFDPQADVTKHQKFPNLHPLGPPLALPAMIGRENPFAPFVADVSVTSTTGTAVSIVIPTSTEPVVEPTTIREEETVPTP